MPFKKPFWEIQVSKWSTEILTFQTSYLRRRHELKEFYDLKYGQKQGTRFVVANVLRNKVVELLNDNTNLSMNVSLY